MKTSIKTNSIHPSPLQLGLPRVQPIWIIRGFLLIPLVLASFALSPTARAVLPAPDGGYPSNNTAEGDDALFSLTTGTDNTATGFDALYSNDAGNRNTATGSNALFSNTTGGSNTANGAVALYSNTTGFDNTANGAAALFSNTTGFINTANGATALTFNTTGARNTATGFQALYSNTKGGQNTATGLSALFSNTTGYYNTANGYEALYSNIIGNSNTAEGYQALKNNTGAINIGLGVNAGLNLTTGSHNIDIGNGGVAGESGTMRIGGASQTRTFIAAIRGVITANADAVPVMIDSAGQLGTMSSSKRFKKEIKPMDQTSEAILGLKPVTFQYKSDSTGTAQFGLIAEEVAKVNPDLVVRDEKGKIYTVRYDAVNAMLLNEFLKEHRKVQELEATTTQQQQAIKALTASVKAQASQIQRVSAQLEVSKPAPQMADNHQ
jgi:endosialidase-like protein